MTDERVEPMAGCGLHTLAEAETVVGFDGVCPTCLLTRLDSLERELEVYRERHAEERADFKALERARAQLSLAREALGRIERHGREWDRSHLHEHECYEDIARAALDKMAGGDSQDEPSA